LHTSHLSFSFSWSETPGHMGAGIVQQDDAVSECTGRLFFDICKQTCSVSQ
jgi:hypothetical protein